jgi:hypothetical protein
MEGVPFVRQRGCKGRSGLVMRGFLILNQVNTRCPELRERCIVR